MDGAEAARIIYGGNVPEKSINDILHEIQVKLSVPKTRYNAFGKYNYRNAEDIVDAVKGLLPTGCALTLSDEMIMLGNRFYIKAQALLFCNGSQIIVYGWAREPQEQKGMAESQITGAASSYARKYALNGLFAIDDGVDADSQNNGQNAPKVPNLPKVLTPEQKLEAAQKKAQIIISEYKNCKDLGMLADVQEKYHSELRRFSEGYDSIFSQINTVGLQVIASFDQ